MKKIFFALSPLLFYKVAGNSMIPQYSPGDTVIAHRILFRVKVNDVIVLTHPRTGRLLLKRIKKVKQNRYFVVGDNEKESTDSRSFGWIEKKDIVGKVI